MRNQAAGLIVGLCRTARGRGKRAETDNKETTAQLVHRLRTDGVTTSKQVVCVVRRRRAIVEARAAQAAMSLLQSTEATRAWLTYREYERVRVLGRGQHGSAVLLRHGVTGECVVSKEVLIDGMDVEVSRCHASPGIASQAVPRRATPPAPTLAQELDKVTTEVLILSTLKHANITGFYGSFQREETLSIVMEYAGGGNLADTIVRQAASGEHFATERVLGWLAQLCSALQVHTYCFPRPTAHRLLTSHCVPTCLRAYCSTCTRTACCIAT